MCINVCCEKIWRPTAMRKNGSSVLSSVVREDTHFEITGRENKKTTTTKQENWKKEDLFICSERNMGTLSPANERNMEIGYYRLI